MMHPMTVDNSNWKRQRIGSDVTEMTPEQIQEHERVKRKAQSFLFFLRQFGTVETAILVVQALGVVSIFYAWVLLASVLAKALL